MTDWKQVAETLKVAWRQAAMPDVHQQVALSRAIVLCLLAAKLPPGEAERVLEAAARRENPHPQAQILADVTGWRKEPTLHLLHAGFSGKCWPTCVRDKARNVRKWKLTADASSVSCLSCLRIMSKRVTE